MVKRAMLLMLLILTLGLNAFAKDKVVDEDFVISKLEDENWIVLDTRLTDAFNGWKMDGLEAGGHILGASDLSYTWIGEKEELIKENMEIRGITSDKNIILYDSNEKDHKIVGEYLTKQGFKNIYYFNLNNESLDDLKMQSYPNYETLVPAWWVNGLLNGEEIENYEGREFKVFETSWGSIKDAVSYMANHIPGSVHINTDEVEPAPEWMLTTDDNLLEFAKNNGIKKDMTVVLYGDDVMASFRIAAVLNYIGVEDVRILNGGFKSWKREGYKTEKGINNKKPLEVRDIKEIQNKDTILSRKKVVENTKDNNFQLVDIRSWKEHIGQESGYSYFHKKGRPEGAIWGKAGTTSVTLEDYRNPDNTFKNGYLMIDMWESLNIDTKKEMSFFCGSGWRAAEVLIYSEIMGFENTSLYSDGWMGWSNDPSGLPVEMGK